MNHRLVIGISRIDPGWRLLLEQIGVSFESIRSPESLDPARQSVMIVNAPPGAEEVEAIENYLRGGGALLDTGFFLIRVDPSSIHRRYRGHVLPAEGDQILGDTGPITLDAILPLHRMANHLQGLVHLTEWKGGGVAHVPVDIGPRIVSTDATRRAFHATSPRHPNEIVSRADKGALRRLVSASLRWLHHRRQLPYLHTPSLPIEHQGVIGFRVDSDDGTRKQVVDMRRALQQAGTATTWFLHVEAHADWLELFTRFDGDEIALHCMRHRTFRTHEENRANLAAGLSALRRVGIEPRGIAAPNGFWNPELARAVEDLGFDYSSEFSLGFDDLPFHPWLHTRFSTLLQVPIHPICLGSFIRAKGTDDDIRRYFSNVVDRGAARQEPVFLYGHPGHERFDLIADEVEHACSRGLAPMTMGAYAAWWKRRVGVRFEGRLDGEDLSIIWKQGDEKVGLITERDGDHAILPGGSMRHDLGKVEWRGALCAPPRQLPGKRPGVSGWRQSLEDFNTRMGQ